MDKKRKAIFLMKSAMSYFEESRSFDVICHLQSAIDKAERITPLSIGQEIPFELQDLIFQVAEK